MSKTDVEILTEQYEKYKDKNSKKARSLKQRIECFQLFADLANGKLLPSQSKLKP